MGTGDGDFNRVLSGIGVGGGDKVVAVVGKCDGGVDLSGLDFTWY